jgi:hypothetical protein
MATAETPSLRCSRESAAITKRRATDRTPSGFSAQTFSTQSLSLRVTGADGTRAYDDLRSFLGAPSLAATSNFPKIGLLPWYE